MTTQHDGETDCLTKLANVRPELQIALAQENDYWLPDPTPATIGAAVLADTLQRNIRSFTAAELTKIFAICEEAIIGNSNDGDVISTGFLEPLQHASGRGDFDFAEIAGYLGETSRAHCIAVDRLHGATTSGL